MKKAAPKSNECFYPLQNAFLIYSPKNNNKNDGVFYNQEAHGFFQDRCNQMEKVNSLMPNYALFVPDGNNCLKRT